MSDDPTGDGVEALVCCQIEGEAPLRARVPVALERGRDLLSRTLDRLAAIEGGRRVSANLQGTVLAFPDTRSAVAFALRLQIELLGAPWPATLLNRLEAAEIREGATLLFRGLRVRCAVHYGWALRRADGGMGGPAVDHLGRLAAAAAGGQVVLGEAAWRTLVGALGTPFVVRDLGAHRFPGVFGQGRVVQVLPTALDGRRFPPLASLDQVRNNLAPVPGGLIGREGDLAALNELLGFGVRWITLQGAPGFGSSRLVRQFAIAQREHHADGGVWWVALPQRPDGAAYDSLRLGDLLRATGDALGVALTHTRTESDAADQIGWSLGSRGKALVILDGLGTVGSEIARVLGGWLKSSSGIRFVATCDRRIGLAGEVVYDLGPMGLPDGEELGDAAWWLIQRAQQVGAGAVDPAHARTLAIELGGSPTALSVAIGLLPVVPADDLATRLSARNGAPERIFEVAWDVASELEREILLLASLFPRAFTPELLAAALPESPAATLEQVEIATRDLVDRGWLHADPAGDEPSRERLAVGGPARRFLLDLPQEEQRLERGGRFAKAILGVAEAVSAHAFDRDSTQAGAWLAGSWPVISAVARSGLGEGSDDGGRVDVGIRALLALQPLFELRGPFATQLTWLDLANRRLDAVLGADALLQARLLFARAEAMWIRGKGRNALPDLERGLEIAQRWGDREVEALCRLGLGLVRAEKSDADPINELLWAAADFEALHLTRRRAIALAAAGRLHLACGRIIEAEATLRDAVENARSAGARRDEGRFLADLARVLWRQGRIDLARASFREAFRLHQETGDRRREAHVASALGDLDHHEGRLAEAARHHQIAARIAREVGERRVEAHGVGALGLIELELGDLDASRRSLLAALAIWRDLADKRGEGLQVGRLGLMHHLSRQRTAARDYFARAIALLGAAGDRRERAVFAAWLASLEAEEGELAEARRGHQWAIDLVAGLEDPAADTVVTLLGCVIDLREASLCVNPSDAARWEGPVRERCSEARVGRRSPPPEVRFALRRVEVLLAEGFPAGVA